MRGGLLLLLLFEPFKVYRRHQSRHPLYRPVFAGPQAGRQALLFLAAYPACI